jgi:hypothetical protein
MSSPLVAFFILTLCWRSKPPPLSDRVAESLASPRPVARVPPVAANLSIKDRVKLCLLVDADHTIQANSCRRPRIPSYSLPRQGQLFADSSLSSYGEPSASLLIERVISVQRTLVSLERIGGCQPLVVRTPSRARPPCPYSAARQVRDCRVADAQRDILQGAWTLYFRLSFCTRQFMSSATYNVLGSRQSMALTIPSSLNCLPARPKRPTTVPSSCIL